MGKQVKVLQKGKITIPAELRDKLGIGEGDYVRLEIVDNKIVLFAPNTVPNPTEVLSGLIEGVRVAEPVKRELKQASSARLKKKAARIT